MLIKNLWRASSFDYNHSIILHFKYHFKGTSLFIGWLPIRQRAKKKMWPCHCKNLTSYQCFLAMFSHIYSPNASVPLQSFFLLLNVPRYHRYSASSVSLMSLPFIKPWKTRPMDHPGHQRKSTISLCLISSVFILQSLSGAVFPALVHAGFSYTSVPVPSVWPLSLSLPLSIFPSCH